MRNPGATDNECTLQGGNDRKHCYEFHVRALLHYDKTGIRLNTILGEFH